MYTALLKELEEPLQKELSQVLERGIYSSIQYFTEYHEFMNKHVLIKELYFKDGVAHIRLSTGDEVPLKEIIRLNKVYSAKHGFGEFSCECD